MPLKSRVKPEKVQRENGRLYVVATPIGHKDDITVRALNILKEVDLIAAEDTRQSGRFLGRHHIKKHFISYHEHNEIKRTPQLIKQLTSGKSIALLSNAGTPVVSDPGYRLIKAAIEHKITVVPIPGVSALTTALSVAGLPTDTFVFVGFPPRKKGRRLSGLKLLADEQRTIIFYESPRRILKLMADIQTVMGDRHAVLGREMTKRYEEFIRGQLSEIIKTLKCRPTLKGEFTLIVSGGDPQPEAGSIRIEEEIKQKLDAENSSPTVLSKTIAQKYGLSKSTAYKKILKIRTEMQR
ncbi:16S rRNA (cytidine(1402)-2'-O)-methyltransferase [Thermodesulfobacteriota bacterium]